MTFLQTTTVQNKAKKILKNVRLHSVLVGVLLRPYQVSAANSVIASCLQKKGLEFLWVFPRQSGKDEAVAQLVALLLTLFQLREVGIVHVYPSSGQIPIGAERLVNRLVSRFADRRWTKTRPVRVGLGKAQCAFFSGHPLAKAEGATANLLLIINESQDQIGQIVDQRFTPMRSSTNATALYVGTARTSTDYLWSKKTELDNLQVRDGVRRVFVIGPDEVGESNPAYLKFVMAQVVTKGRNHPIVKTEYFNEPVDVASGLFPPRRRALMTGTHSQIHSPLSGEVYVALIDVGGQDEAATGVFQDLHNPGRDYTVCTVVRVLPGDDIGKEYQAVDVFVDQGSRHFQDVPGQPSLFARLLTYLNHWSVTAVVCDMTGVGQGLTDALIKSYRRAVFGFDFASGFNKSRLGNDFLAIIETGRFKYFSGQDQEDSDAWWFHLQCEHCGYEIREGESIERGMKWGVAESARVTVRGKSVPIHDDYLLSVALVAEVDRLSKSGELFLGTGESYTIRQPDIISEMDGAEW